MSKVSTKDVIKYSAYLTDIDGYVKRSDDQNVVCTADRVLDAIEDGTISEDDLSDVKDRISQWFTYINDTNSQTGEYFDNLREEVCKPMIDEIKIGLIASSFASFDRYRQFKAKNDADKKSNFLGEEGDRIIFNISDYKLIKTGTSKFSAGKSKWYLYHIHDEFGNVIIFFADHNCDSKFENSTKAAATISKLTTFNDVKQTNVSRVEFL